VTDERLREIEPPAGVPNRYSDRPLPPYRYVPGLHPHPVAHPEGHSHDPTGAHPQAGPLLPADRWRESNDYLFGVDLYNRGYWWEAHEAWEGLWQQTDKSGQQGRFLQGLIQTSAAHLKRHVHQPDGVQRLLERAREHLAAARAGLGADGLYMGVDIADFTQRTDAYFHGETTTFPAIVLTAERSHPPGDR
jgi:hypothetical protein